MNIVRAVRILLEVLLRPHENSRRLAELTESTALRRTVLEAYDLMDKGYVNGASPRLQQVLTKFAENDTFTKAHLDDLDMFVAIAGECACMPQFGDPRPRQIFSDAVALRERYPVST